MLVGPSNGDWVNEEMAYKKKAMVIIDKKDGIKILLMIYIHI